MVPFRRRVTVVVGEPVRVCRRSAHPSDAEVLALQERVVAAMRELFDANKSKHGAADKELEIE